MVCSFCGVNILDVVRATFLVRGTRQNLILTFSAIIGRSKRETRYPAQLTHQVSPRAPIHTPDTRGGKLRTLCWQLSSWKHGRTSCLLLRPYASERVAHAHTVLTQPLISGTGSLDTSIEAASTPPAWFRAFTRVVCSSCDVNILDVVRATFLVGGTGQTLILTFSGMIGRSKSETWCPAQLTHQVSPRAPIRTPDTRGGKLRTLCWQLSSWKHGRTSCLLLRPYASERVAHAHTVLTQPLISGTGSLDTSIEAASTPPAWFRAFTRVVCSSCDVNILDVVRATFLVGGTGQTLILTFSGMIGRSKSETWCPAQLTHQVSPRTPKHTPDTHDGKLRPLCWELSSWKQGRTSCALPSGRVARAHTMHTQVRICGKGSLDTSIEAASTRPVRFRAFAGMVCSSCGANVLG